VIDYYLKIESPNSFYNIFSKHFIGIGAMYMKYYDEDSNFTVLNVKFDIGLTIASLLAPIFCVYYGLTIASHDRVYTKSKEEVLEMLVEDARLAGTKISSKRAMIFLALFKNPTALILGGVLTATGVCVMHYIGMVAMRFDGYIEWNIGIVFTSVLIAVVVSIVGFWILFRLLALYPQRENLRVASAAVIALAVCSMHYTGMFGGRFYYQAGKLESQSVSLVDSTTALYAALVMSLIVSWVMNILVLADIRAWYENSNKIILQTDAIFHTAATTPNAPVGTYYNRYTELRKISVAVAKSRSVAPTTGQPKQTVDAMKSRGGVGRKSSVEIFLHPPAIAAYKS